MSFSLFPSFSVQVARLDFIASDKTEEKWDRSNTILKVYYGNGITTGSFTSKSLIEGKPQTLLDYISSLRSPPLAPPPRIAEVVEVQDVPFFAGVGWGGVGAGAWNVNFFRALLIEFDHHVGRTPVKRCWEKELPRMSQRFPKMYNLQTDFTDPVEGGLQPSELWGEMGPDCWSVKEWVVYQDGSGNQRNFLLSDSTQHALNLILRGCADD